jgi:hypothetical protein
VTRHLSRARSLPCYPLTCRPFEAKRQIVYGRNGSACPAHLPSARPQSRATVSRQTSSSPSSPCSSSSLLRGRRTTSFANTVFGKPSSECGSTNRVLCPQLRASVHHYQPSAFHVYLHNSGIGRVSHVAEIGLPKQPGQVRDSSGIGNDDFDASRNAYKYGYPVLALRRLVVPLDVRSLKERFGVAPPQGFMYAPRPLCEAFNLDEMIKVF